MQIESTAQLKEEFALRAAIAELQIECGMDGSYLSEVAVIAEAPGGSEVAQGLPLVGASGRLFWTSAREHMKLSRKDCYITNVCKRQVAFADVAETRRPIGKHELTGWQELLKWELEQLPNLKYVILLGNYALEALTGHEGITKWRGSVVPIMVGKRRVMAMVANNPAMCIREPKSHIMFNMDMAKFLRVLRGTFREHKIDVIINPSFRDAMQYLDKVQREGKPISSDIEVIQGETACVGFANGAHEAISIPFRTADDHFYTLEEERILRRKMQAVYTDPRTRHVMQNGHFDCTWLWYKDKIAPQPLFFDTMLAHHTLYPTMPHNLGFLVTQYTDHPYYKDEKDDWRTMGSINDFWIYNGKDCALTWAVHEAELSELRDQHLYKFFIEHVMRVQPHLIRMTVGGIKVDMSLKEGLKAGLNEALEEKLKVFHAACAEATGDPDYRPNPNSPKQMSELFFSKLRLVGRGTSTDATNRELMFKHPRTTEPARRLITALNDYKEDHKFFSVYADSEADPDGYMRTTYNQIGVQSAPGRLSSSATMWGSGMNLQNQPDRAKPMFIADEGYCFVYIDGSQAEARYVGWDANIVKWIEQFERARLEGGYDAHCALASEMFNIPYDDVPTFDRYDSDHPVEEGHILFPNGVTVRFVAKRCRHGLNYRMMPDRLSLTTGLPIEVAQDAFTKYHRATPELRQWWKDLEDEIRKTKMLFNAYGRRYLQLEPMSQETLAPIVAFKPQSTIGDMLQRVIYKCHDDPKWPKCSRIVLNIHDALIALSRIEDWKQTARIMVKHAEEPIMVRGRPLIIPADAAVSVPDHVGPNGPLKVGVHRWSTIKKVKRKDFME
jgi:uracil-DNA glycosylase family 4